MTEVSFHFNVADRTEAIVAALQRGIMHLR